MKTVHEDIVPGRIYQGGTLGMSVRVVAVRDGRVQYLRVIPPSRYGSVYSKPLDEFREWINA